MQIIVEYVRKPKEDSPDAARKHGLKARLTSEHS
jgi:hypothetical protein